MNLLVFARTRGNTTILRTSCIARFAHKHVGTALLTHRAAFLVCLGWLGNIPTSVICSSLA